MIIITMTSILQNIVVLLIQLGILACFLDMLESF